MNGLFNFPFEFKVGVSDVLVALCFKGNHYAIDELFIYHITSVFLQFFLLFRFFFFLPGLQKALVSLTQHSILEPADVNRVTVSVTRWWGGI